MAKPAKAVPSKYPARSSSHTLSVRMSVEEYRRLRNFVVAVEQKTGKRITHQSVFMTALDEYLTKGTKR